MSSEATITLADALGTLAGKGWHRVDRAQIHKGEQIGFALADHRVTRPWYGHGAWYKVGSWTTGAGRGWHHYRGENIGDTGYTVDWIDANSWPETLSDAYLAVHDENGRGAGQHEWREGVPPSTDSVLEDADE